MATDETPAPADLLPGLRTSVTSLLASAAALGDEDVRAPSLLPGWSRAHVLTHVARSADSRSRLLAAARTGADVPQYTDEAHREREIEEGAGRSAAALAEDLATALRRFLRAAAEHPEDGWDVPVRWLGGGMRPVRGAVASMLREVEVHHTDLRTGHRPHGLATSLRGPGTSLDRRGVGRARRRPLHGAARRGRGSDVRDRRRPRAARDGLGSRASRLADRPYRWGRSGGRSARSAAGPAHLAELTGPASAA